MATKIDGKSPGGGSEFRREREMYRYLPPFAASYLPQHHRGGDNSGTSPSRSPKAYSSEDRALNAFAQLGALRLRTKRAMISLIDRKYQYILAEATQSLSSQCDNVHDAGDSLWLGVRTIPRNEGFCAAIMTPPVSRDDCADGHRPALAPRIIHDLAANETMKNRSYVLSGKIRFYAGVPIRTRLGFDIGSYCVLDDQPRAGVNAIELEFLQDMADTIMDHLEYVAARRDYQRGEKMVKGLGLFVEGHSSISDWWLRTRDERRSVHQRNVQRKDRAEASQDAQRMDFPKSNHPPGAGDRTLKVSRSPESRPSPPLPEEGSTTFSKITSGKSSRRPSTESLNEGREGDQSSTRTQPVSPGAQASSPSTRPISPRSTHSVEEPMRESVAIPINVAASSPDSPELVPGTSTERQDSDIAKSIKEMLSRASNLIRESTDVDGVIFFDAKHSGFGSQGLKSSLLGANIKSTTEGNLTTSSSENESRSSSRSSSQQGPSDTGSDQGPRHKTTGAKPRMCEVLAYSSTLSSSLHGQDCSPSHLTVTESFVTKLFKHHPHGNIFMFDEDGAISSGEDEIKQATVTGEISIVAGGKSRKSDKILESETILKIFPGSRSVLTLPLWDSHRERWFASAMLWTSDPVRVLSSKDDLNYVAAFGNSIMAEVSRLDTVMADHTKTTLISSISHELRSPLHGVLGSIELLEDTSVTEYQRDVLDTIGHCSMTLLDTLNNVLDYAKINNFTTAQKKEQKVIRKSSRSRKAVPAEKFRIYGTISLTSDLDLASITEEVIGGMYTGHEYSLRSKSHASGADIDYHVSSNRLVEGSRDNSPLSIILDIDKKSNWMFSTQPGAWKRILMNLFGNALKFTTSGLVKVQLEYKDVTQPKLRLNQAFVTITITDTGKGIAPDFLRGHIFTPFSQEDTLTPGAGLGLSIVRQIVGALDGKLEISSVQGCGTVAKACLKLEKSRPHVNHAIQCPENIRRAKASMNGLELVLVGFEDNTIPENETIDQSEILSVTGQPNTLAAISSAISKISRNWFGLRTTKASGFDGFGDVFLTTSENFLRLEEEWLQDSSLSKDFSKRRIIVLQNNTLPENRVRSRKDKNIHFLSNPIGPRKLADCFLSLFDNPVTSDVDKDSLETYDTPSTPISLGINIAPSNADPILSIRNLDPSSPPSTNGVANRASPEQATIEPAILIVEDNPINMKILAASISKLQAQLHTAGDGQQAVDHYKTTPRKPDLIFMDISMPIMNGFEATRHIRAFERENRLSASIIVAVTGLASDESQREAYNSGINLFLSKPVPLREMKKIVDEWKARIE